MFEVSSECEDKECQKQIGAAPIASRWDVINQGDATNVDIRARLLVKQFKKTSVESIFAPTLLLAALRFLCSPVLTNRSRSKELPRLLPNTHWRADVPAGDDAKRARQEGDVRNLSASEDSRRSRDRAWKSSGSSVPTMFC